MKKLVAVFALLISGSPFYAHAQAHLNTANPHGVPGEGVVPAMVPYCVASGSTTAAVCSATNPLPVTGTITTSGSNAFAQTPFPSTSIAAANTYQQIAAPGACPHGGSITATQTASSTGMIYVDTTGVTAGGTTLSNGAIPLGGSQATNQPGQNFTIPPTTNSVMVYGPSGATYRGYCS